MKPVEKILGRLEGVVESEGSLASRSRRRGRRRARLVSSQESTRMPCGSVRKMKSPPSPPLTPTAVTTPQ